MRNIKQGGQYRYGPYVVRKSSAGWEVVYWGEVIETCRTKREARDEAIKLSIEELEGKLG